jgi:hypothetical protein
MQAAYLKRVSLVGTHFEFASGILTLQLESLFIIPFHDTYHVSFLE